MQSERTQQPDSQDELVEPTAAEPTGRGKRSDGVGFPIVGVGASAGGLEAFTELLTALPLDTGMAFVLVQHLDPDHESALTQILSRATSLPVGAVTNNQTVEPNHVYVIPPDTNLRIARGILRLEPRPKARVPHRPIDSFLESLSQDQREQAIGVILSGTASDGTLGLEAIKAEGGITFAQDDSAKYDSMPRSAVAAGCVDLVLSPEKIARELARIANHPCIGGQPFQLTAAEPDDRAEMTAGKSGAQPLPSGENDPLDSSFAAESDASTRETENHTRSDDAGYLKTLSLLRQHSGVDFSLYKFSTIQRRIARRLVISRQNTLEEYANFLRGNTKELDALCADVLISVTSFFRNPEIMEVLQREVLVKLLKQPGDSPVRVWVPGCSTGQEAYSIAIAFVESTESLDRSRTLKVFATDLNNELLEKARRGLYPKSLSDEISPERLRRFFVEEQGGYRVTKSLREMVVFARQNLFGDPPFSRMDLISCRNLLIYLGPDLQRKAIPTFHYALKPGGFLLLGASETIGNFTDLFEPLDRKSRIYSRRTVPTPAFQITARREHGERAITGRRELAGFVRPSRLMDNISGELTAQREADRVTVNQFAPPGVLVDEALQVLQFRGATGDFLEPPVGKPNFDVLKMAKDGLMLPLRSAIEEAKTEKKTIRRENIRLNQHDKIRVVNLEIIPLRNVPEPCYLILFEDADITSRESSMEQTARPRLSRNEEDSRIAELKTELSETREYLLALQQQYEAANEELLAAGEEAQSANEELQSINEELETSREELESTNEELTTVNEEMIHRNAELNSVNSDLVNFQNSTRLVMLLLGRDLTVRRFSPQAEKQFNLLAADVGRPVSHIRHNLFLAGKALAPLDLEALCTEVITTQREQEREVLDRSGLWHSLRLRPYRTLDQHVEGAVLVLLEIDELKQSEQSVATARDYAENIVETVRDPLLVLDRELRVESANRSFHRVFGISPAESVGKFIFELGDRQWDIPRLRELMEEILHKSTIIEEFRVEHDFKQLGRRTMLLNARSILNPLRDTEHILLAIEDITERTQMEENLQASETLYRRLFETAKDGVLILDADTGRILEANPYMTDLSGYPTTEFIGRELWEVGLFHDKAANDAAFRELQQKGSVRYDHLPLKSNRDQPVEVEFVSNIYQWNQRLVAQCHIRDISDRSRLEKQTQLHQAELTDLHQRKDEFLAMLSHELRSPLAPIANAVELLALQQGSENTIQQKARCIIERQMRQLQRLVEDLLEVSRITSGRVQLRKERGVVCNIVEDAVETVRPLIEQHGHQLTVVMPPDPIWLNADIIRLEQILVNLLTNAAKYTQEGGLIEVNVQQDGEQCNFRVKDNGAGIAENLLPHIFDLFTQAERSLDRSQGGLGIGLALAKRLTELHGGTVEATSESGKGSEFTVRLPIAPPEFPPPEATTASIHKKASRALRIMLVDDDVDTVLSFSLLLSTSGHVVRTASDGLSAIHAALDFKPDVLLLDIGLPVMNGYQVAQRIRQEPSLQNIMLVALTGYGQESDRQTALQAGFDHHLVKPARLDQLQEILNSVDVTSE